MTMTRTIQRAAQETGLSADTLRYYERIGILPGIGRSESGHRRFTDDDMGWIKLVQCLRATGMPLEDLHRYAELVQAGEHTAAERLAILEAHKDRIESE
jgi:DNA-binding transcriptional MerR regulator